MGLLGLATISTKIKLWAGAGVFLLLLAGVIAFLFHGWQGAEKEAARLGSEIEVLEQVNAKKDFEISRLIQEKEAAEKASAQLQRDKEAVIESKNEELARVTRELEDARKTSEELDSFLSVPVPDDFLNWMSNHHGDQMGQGSGDDDSDQGHAGAATDS